MALYHYATTGMVGEEMLIREVTLPDAETLSLLPNVRVIFEAANNSGEEFELAVKGLIEGIYARLSVSVEG